MSKDMAFAEAVRRLRRERGISQEALARDASVSNATLARIEAGRSDPKWTTARDIAGALGIPLQDLIPSRPPLTPSKRTPKIGPALGATVARLRRERKMSRRGLAVDANVSEHTLENIERGASSPRMSTLQALADALGVDLHDLADAAEPAQED